MYRPIRDSIGDQLEVILDGGIRRGTHILKALAQGENVCSIDRPYLYDLAAADQAGVEHALHILRAEVERSMGLAGVNSIKELSSQQLFNSKQTLLSEYVGFVSAAMDVEL